MSDRLINWQAKSFAYYDCAETLARSLGIDLISFSYLYSRGSDLHLTKAFLGLSEGPTISCELTESVLTVAYFFGMHLAYNAMAHENVGAALVAHQCDNVSHPSNTPSTTLFINKVNNVVIDHLTKE